MNLTVLWVAWRLAAERNSRTDSERAVADR
jgi:hypothetical protein